MSNLPYDNCSHVNGGRCLNEGWLFCNICKRRYCDDHACIHMSADITDEAEPKAKAELDNGFREKTQAEIKALNNGDLASYRSRLFQELKRVSTEYDARSITTRDYVVREVRKPIVKPAPKPAKLDDARKAQEKVKAAIDAYFALHGNKVDAAKFAAELNKEKEIKDARGKKV